MSIILPWLISHSREIGIGLLVISLVLVLRHLHGTNLELSEIRGRLEQKVEQCRVIEQEHARAKAEWDAKIAEAEQRKIESEKRVGRIRSSHETKVREILTAPIVPTCEGAVEYLRNQAGAISTW